MKLRYLPTLLLPVLLGVGVAVSGMTVEAPEGGWVASSPLEAQIAAEVRESKPRNVWTTEDLEAAGWTGCVAVDDDEVTFEHAPEAHVVRLPVAEGWNWVRMPAAEVAKRMEVFGGTTTTKDDVTKLVANCY